MNALRRVLTVIIPTILTVVLVACSQAPASNLRDETKIVSQQQDIYNKAQPIPLYDFSEQRNTLIQIYNAKNEARQTWALFMSQTGVPVYPYVCPSIGLPIPADTQLSNPEQLVYHGNYSYSAVPQPEPDGLYNSSGTDATYVVCIRTNGQPELIYTENKVTSVSHEVIFQNGQFVDTGKAPSIPLSIVGGNSSVAPVESPKP